MKTLLLLAALPLMGQVSYERILNSSKEPGNWLTYSGNYSGHRFSPLEQINDRNVQQLKPLWTYQTNSLQKFETTPLVIDMVEQGLSEATQEALVAQLRRRGPAARPLILMTRSNAVLDLAAVGPDEAILYCPANHSPPIRVAAHPGAPGYEALASCLAPPEVRARTEGMVAIRPPAA